MDIKDGNIFDGNNGLLQENKAYLEDFLIEVREIIEDIELEMVNLQMDPRSKDSLNFIYCSFNTLRGMAGLLNNPLCNKIINATEELLDTVRNNSSLFNKNIFNRILDSVNFIKKLCTDTPVIFDYRFIAEAEEHIQAVSKINDDILQDNAQSGDNSGSSRADASYGSNEPVLREKKVDATDIIKEIRTQKIRTNGNTDQYVKIPLERLDQIIEIIREVENIYDSLKNEITLRFGTNDSLTEGCAKSYYLINDIKKILTELRMVTLHQAFQKLTRLTCSFIEEHQLEVKFSTIGENVEVDKDIADKLVLPLGELIKLLLETRISVTDKTELCISNIEVMAYEENDLVNIDINSDMDLNPEDFGRAEKLKEIRQQLNSLNCALTLGSNADKGLRITISIRE